MVTTSASFWTSLIIMAAMVGGVMAVLMRASGQSEGGNTNTNTNSGARAGAGASSWVILIALLVSAGIYGMLGKPDMGDAPLHMRADALQKKAAIEAMEQELANRNLAAAKQQLDENPDDIVAMLMLAEAAATAGQYETEIAALERAFDQSGHPTIRSMLAEALTRQADGIVTEQAAELLLQSLTENLDDWRAAYLYGLYLSQNGNDAKATLIWQDLGRRASREDDGTRMLELVNNQLRDLAARTGQPEADLIIAPMTDNTDNTASDPQ